MQIGDFFRRIANFGFIEPDEGEGDFVHYGSEERAQDLNDKRVRGRQSGAGRERQFQEIEEAQRGLGRGRRGVIDSIKKSKQNAKFPRNMQGANPDEFDNWWYEDGYD